MDEQTVWRRVIQASARLQVLVPDSVLVGGSAAALRARHRVSYDDDHVLHDLSERFDEVLEALEASEGWVTARVRRPMLILGSLEGVETGIRQLLRRRPLEAEELDVEGIWVRVPTLAETARIKAWLILVRNATRDYLDFAALGERLGDATSGVVLGMDEYYADQRGPEGARVTTQLLKQLAEPAPYDLSTVDLHHFRGTLPRWQEWGEVVGVCRALGARALRAAGGATP